MKIERIQLNASEVPTTPARKLKTESNQIITDDAVTFDADRQQQKQHYPESQPPFSEEEEADKDVALAAATAVKPTVGSIDIVV